MELFLIKTERYLYTTNAESKKEAITKFGEVYPDYVEDIVDISTINPEEIGELDDNDSIIFF